MKLIALTLCLFLLNSTTIPTSYDCSSIETVSSGWQKDSQGLYNLHVETKCYFIETHYNKRVIP